LFFIVFDSAGFLHYADSNFFLYQAVLDFSQPIVLPFSVVEKVKRAAFILRLDTGLSVPNPFLPYPSYGRPCPRFSQIPIFYHSAVTIPLRESYLGKPPFLVGPPLQCPLPWSMRIMSLPGLQNFVSASCPKLHGRAFFARPHLSRFCFAEPLPKIAGAPLRYRLSTGPLFLTKGMENSFPPLLVAIVSPFDVVFYSGPQPKFPDRQSPFFPVVLHYCKFINCSC